MTRSAAAAPIGRESGPEWTGWAARRRGRRCGAAAGSGRSGSDGSSASAWLKPGTAGLRRGVCGRRAAV